MLKWFSDARNPVKSGPKMAIFQQFGGINIKYSNRNPKTHFLTGNDVFWCILRKNPFKGLGCSLMEEPEEKHTSHIKRHGKITYLRSGNPQNRSLNNLQCRVPFDGVGCIVIEEPQKRKNKSPKAQQGHVFGEQKF